MNSFSVTCIYTYAVKIIDATSCTLPTPVIKYTIYKTSYNIETNDHEEKETSPFMSLPYQKCHFISLM